MISKSEISDLSKLKLKKYRDQQNKFVVEGKRFVEEGLKSKFACDDIIITNQFAEKEEEYHSYLKSQNCNLNVVNSKDFIKLSSTKNPQGVLAIFKIPEKENWTINGNVIICLENISDPGNLGTILRSCDWFGIKTVILSKDCADLYNPKVLRASMGAIFHLDIMGNRDLNLEIQKLREKGYLSYYADMSGKDYRSVDYHDKIIITFCNEAFGPSNRIKTISDDAITIPKVGTIDSLNVAAAAAIILSKTN